MRTVAVTGGIGSGKSAVCAILARIGIPVYDSDSATKRLYGKDDTLLDTIEEAFGCGLRQPDGSLDKKKLASIVFPAPEKLKVLESIVHPAVLADFKRWKAMQSSRFEDIKTFFGKEPFCVMESAIILDKPDFLMLADKVVMVDTTLEKRLKRACDRDQAQPEKIIQRISAQHFDLSKVDAIIRNNGTLDQLESETVKVFGGLEF